MLVGRAWAIRLGPGKPEAIITAPIKADESRYLVATAAPGWGLGGLAQPSLDRAAVGVLVSPPPRGRREVLFGAGFEQHGGRRGGWVCVGVVWRRGS